MLGTDHCRSGRVGSDSQGPDGLKKVGYGVQGKEICDKVGSSLVLALARLKQDDHGEFEVSLDYVVFFFTGLGFTVRLSQSPACLPNRNIPKNSA